MGSRVTHGQMSSWISQTNEKGRELAGHTDVMLKIAEYLLPKYFTLDTEESLLPEEIAEPSFIASEPVWGCFNEFQGVRYAGLLSNQKDSLHDLTIYNPQDDKTADVVYKAINCIGVVDVIFAHSSEPVKVDEALSIWWRVFAINYQVLACMQSLTESNYVG
ncbi:Hypothetical protein NCS54_00437200 [Fusarium falciforme]|uniref:Hypothetical protein n=1 Tax=Fusarium falciforme TaxID=195108 RepID=UPI002301A284|nr:Hypothetical protein NCS54_00437200 [Fusarium falciforme]WAO87077.1 Hypothetical protein NCS54_00437200 [Fusarium falciforme]